MDGFTKVAAHLSKNTRYAWVGLACLWALVFVPHLLHSGFISDDWSVVRSGLTTPGFWDRFASWFPLFANRPAAPLVLSFFSGLFGGWTHAYIAMNVTMWLASLILLARVLLRFLSLRFLVVFLALASFPSMASTVMFSLVMQQVALVSILFWVVSLYLLDRHLGKYSPACLFASYGFVLLSLVIYEITLPFLVLNLLYPLLFDHERHSPLRRYAARYLMPVFLVLAGIFIFQKLVMPSFMPVYSRLSPGSFGIWVASFCTWFWSLLVDFPLLLLDACQRIFVTNANEVNLQLASFAVAGLFAVLLFGISYSAPLQSPAAETPEGKKYGLLCIAATALLSASLLFVLSGSGAQIGGYLNRAMTSTWLLLALVVAITCDIYWRGMQKFLVFALLVLNACSFMLQRENYAISWKLQDEITRSVIKSFQDADAPPRGTTVLAHVPRVVPSPYNDEEVFQNYWDISMAVWFADHRFDINAMPVSQSGARKLVIGPELVKLHYWESDFSNLWFYEYNARFGNSRFFKVANAAELKAVAAQVAEAEFNVWPRSVAARVREAVYHRGSFVILIALLLLCATRLLPASTRRKAGAPVSATPGSNCRVCGGFLFSRLKESDFSDEITSADFRVTDSGYGATCAIDICAGCGFLQSTCADVLGYYERMEDPEYESGRLARGKQFDDILEELSRWSTGGRLLDVGAGTGILVELALNRGFRAQGIEPSEWMARQAGDKGLPVLAGVLPDERVAGPFAAVTLLDVIEHVSDPAGILRSIHDLLEPDGYLLLTTPDVDSFAARVMGKRWWHFRIAHISYFAPRTIELLLQRSGFEVVKVKRTGWYFELSYLVERLMKYLPGAPSVPLPARLSSTIIPLNLYDSMLLVCRRKP
ncbi:MAG: hypothetical protein A2075_15640 [Geobacteraceae bacterium GWC2_58_44]|nr:MAG: hypothetical protein A2075_15640 [Geobacteraceae bacterium GWC2_58_44]HBG06017.1 hypothetical protein [Geobacter sp.]